MRTILGYTKDTLITIKRYMLALSSIRSRHRLTQAKAYMSVVGDNHIPYKRTYLYVKGTRIKRESPWMA